MSSPIKESLSARIARELRTHVVGVVAVVVALSGTAYALETNSVGSKELAPNSVGSSELKNNAVGGSEVDNGALGAPEFGGFYCGYMGQLMLLGWTGFTPGQSSEATLPANGATLTLQQYTALFSLLGTTYGGDGQKNFNLPNVSGPIGGTAHAVCIDGGIYPQRP